MAPAKIMIIRHAEKPPKTGDALGVAENGSTGDDDGKSQLIVPGWMRAGALVPLFAPPHGPAVGLATPDHLFACKIDGQSSHRPHDTILPLARMLRKDINLSYGQDDYPAMIDEALKRQGAVLICWEHKRIHKITALIPRRDQQPPVEYKWPGTRFDVVFVFDRVGDEYVFSQVTQLLLVGDSDEPIDTRFDPKADENDE
jgi:hypothetical protein